MIVATQQIMNCCVTYIRVIINYASSTNGDSYLVLATAWPGANLGDTAVAVNPDNERYYN